MTKQVLIVEDQVFIAMSVEDAVIGLGYNVAGIAASEADVEQIQAIPDVALVDVNLLDGATGPRIGRSLAAKGCRVVFMTANPEALGDGVDGALGVIPKPVRDLDLIRVIEFAVADDHSSEEPPSSLKLFA